MKSKLNAFTLVEVLVVIVAISILSTAIFIGYSAYLRNSNDAKRSSNIAVIQEALEKYYDENGEYPSCSAMTQTPATISANTLRGIPTDVFQAPGGSANSIICSSSVPQTTFNSIYSGYDLLYCRYATDCTGITGITSDSSYQVAFTAKAGSRYSFNMVQIDGTSTNWTTGTNITTNITYTTPTTGATIGGNVIFTANSGDTRITFTGTGPANKTVFIRLTEVDSNSNAISTASSTKAVGVYTTVGSYTLTSPASASVDYLVVAGGGGGAQDNAGGGGAGGYRTGSLSLVAGSYTATVGAGGGRTTAAGSKNNGGNSVFSTITSTGGGAGGGSATGGPANNGGSGGGCGGNVGAGGSGTAGQGNSGATGTTAAGGGGAGSAGATNGNGGAGLSSTITGSSTFYAGGGAGNTGTGGTGGGGTNSGFAVAANNGTDNKGGGGSAYFGAWGGAGNGGSGIVILRGTYTIATTTPTVSNNQFVYVGDGTADCSGSAFCSQYTLYYKEEVTGAVKSFSSRRSFAVTSPPNLTSPSPILTPPNNTYDLIYCRFTTDCSTVAGISSNSSYQLAFTAKAGSRYSFNMAQIDGTSTSWTTGTNITTNITYATPTAGATISGNVITTANAGQTRITFTGTGLNDKTVFARLTEVDSNGNSISTTTSTKALGVYTTAGSYTLTSPAAASISYLLVSGGGGGGGVQNEQAYAGYGGQGLSGTASLVAGNYTISVGAGGNRALAYNYTPSNGGSSGITGSLVSATAQGGKSGTSRCYSAYGGCAGTGGADPAAGYIGGSTTFSFTGTSVTYGVSAGGGALNTGAPSCSGTAVGCGGGAPWCTANCAGTAGTSGQVVIRL